MPRRPSSSRSRIALCELERLASFEARPLSYDPVFRFLDAPWRVGFGPRPWTALALASMSFDGGARQARSLSPHGGPDAPLARLTFRASFAMGTANAGDPGRHRPMSATHDSVIKTGTLRPGTLHSVFPHLAVARAFTALQPASAFADASRGSVRPSQRFRAYRACFVTRGIPGRTRLVASTSVARGSRTPERVRAQGQPPDGLDLRHRIA